MVSRVSKLTREKGLDPLASTKDKPGRESRCANTIGSSGEEASKMS